MYSNNHIIIFTRFPVPGKTKTRLIPSLGPEKAADLQRRMTEKVAQEALDVSAEHDVTVSVFYTNGRAEQMTDWLGDTFNYYPQTTGDIGKRMEDAFRLVLQDAAESAILIGSDIPDINREIIEQAICALQESDTVVGPSTDGGYYLIGMTQAVSKKLFKHLFAEIVWSTDQVFEQTIKRLKQAGCSCTILQALQDIDRPEDLKHIQGRALL